MKQFLFGLFFCSLVSQSLAAQPEKAAMCSGCHGASGISTNPDWPSLAGQNANYLAKQLRDYKDAKTRNAPIMSPLVAAFTDDDIRELAAYYASLPLPIGSTSKQYQARGEAIYRRGDVNKHITACIVCHGPKGTGNAQAGFPALSGQQPAYTIQQLNAFKTKTRRNDLNSIMRDISHRMSEDDMTAVAHYLYGLH